MGMDIVKDSTPKAAIVLADVPSAVASYAAKELQHHIELATGVQLQIVSETDSVALKDLNFIHVGPGLLSEQVGIDPGQLPANGFYLRGTERALFLVGNDGSGKPPLDDVTSMGSLFAVYRWLDEHLGVRWLWPGDLGIVVPRIANIVSEVSDEKKIVPTMIHSRLRIGFGIDKMKPDVRDRYLWETNVWLRRQLIARPTSFEYGHAYTKYWNRFGESHPEYFALRSDGKRGPVDERNNLVQLCLSNADLKRQIIEDWLVQREQTPEKPWINGIENDRRESDPFCSCDRCRVLDSRLSQSSHGTKVSKGGSMSDRYARFWLMLQEEGRKKHPDAVVIGYAYSDYAEPPKEVKLNADVVVGIVPTYRYPAEKEDVAKFRALWSGWKETQARLYLRPNYFLSGYNMPYIFARQFGDDFKYSLENGLIATDFDSLTGMWGVQGPNLYVLGRLHARPDLTVSEILNEYYSGFGPAREEVERYFDYWESVTKKCDKTFSENSKGGWALISKSGDDVFTSESFSIGRKMLESAGLAAAGHEMATERVEYLSVWLTHAELSMNALRAFHALKANPGNSAFNSDLQIAKKELDEFRDSHAKEFSAANLQLLKQVEQWSGWR